MSNTKEVYLTEEGYDKIKKELEYLINKNIINGAMNI